MAGSEVQLGTFSSENEAKDFDTLGMIVARMVPRVLDTVPEVRTAAVDIISSVAKLHGLFHPKDVQEGEVDIEAICSSNI